MRSASKGLTLIELLFVSAILVIIFTVVAIYADAPTRLRESRDARRMSDVETILNGIHTYILDSGGKFPPGMSQGMPETQLGYANSGCQVRRAGCQAEINKCLNLINPLSKYLSTIPIDPSLTINANTTNYTVSVDNNRIVTVRACGVESGGEIVISR